MNYFGIPKSDYTEFSLLRPDIRNEVEHWVLWLTQIEAHKPTLPAIKRIAEKNNLKVPTIYRKLSVYQKFGWRGLINRAKYPIESPPASSILFVRFLHMLWLANNKNYRNTHRQIVAIWKGGAPIPGYKHLPPKSPFNEFPDGWTCENLRYHIITFIENHSEQITSR